MKALEERKQRRKKKKKVKEEKKVEKVKAYEVEGHKSAYFMLPVPALMRCEDFIRQEHERDRLIDERYDAEKIVQAKEAELRRQKAAHANKPEHKAILKAVAQLASAKHKLERAEHQAEGLRRKTDEDAEKQQRDKEKLKKLTHEQKIWIGFEVGAVVISRRRAKLGVVQKQETRGSTNGVLLQWQTFDKKGGFSHKSVENKKQSEWVALHKIESVAKRLSQLRDTHHGAHQRSDD